MSNFYVINQSQALQDLFVRGGLALKPNDNPLLHMSCGNGRNWAINTNWMSDSQDPVILTIHCDIK